MIPTLNAVSSRGEKIALAECLQYPLHCVSRVLFFTKLPNLTHSKLSNLGQENVVMPELINICEQAARLGGAELLRWKGKFSVTEKSVADLVTEADFASQRAIYDLLTREFPDHGFHGEEELSVMENTKADLHSDHCWVVDPLDGTTNYVHGLPYYCVSVAMVAHGKTQVAAVYDPERDECFSAIAGENSKCNGQLIFTSDAEKVSESLLVTGFGPNAAGKTHEMDWFMRASTQAQSLRRMGAAACPKSSSHPRRMPL